MMKSHYTSTNLIMQYVYDDNAIKKLQIREVFGLAITLDMLKINEILSK